MTDEPRVIEGPSYHPAQKALATLIVVALMSFAVRIWPQLMQLDAMGKAMLGIAVLAVLATWFGMLGSRTRIDGETICQRGLWTKEVRLAEITRLQLIHVRGLAWLIAPRLVVRTGGLTRQVFPAADPRVLDAFRALAFGEAPRSGSEADDPPGG